VIAWADQYTDDLTKADLHGIQTQSDVVGNWADTQVQMSVLVPFHFIPGNDDNYPWMTTRNYLTSVRFGHGMLFSKLWFAYNKTMEGDYHEFQKNHST
jgi:hypothetical protein